MENMMTLSEFAKRSGKSESTIRRNWRKIPGADKVNGEIYFPVGSRYPFDMHRYRNLNTAKRYDIILKATNNNMYIDEDMLNVSKNEFDFLLQQLLSKGFLDKYESNNSHGANEYLCTMKYKDEIYDKRADTRISRILQILPTVIPASVELLKVIGL